jgi:hypothetical protein
LFFWCVVVVVVPASPLFLMLKNAYEKWRITSAQRRCGRSNARHRLKHTATRLPTARPPEAPAEVLSRKCRWRTYGPATRTRRRYIAARVICHCRGKAGNNYSTPLRICRVVFVLPQNRRDATCNGPGATIKHPRRTTSGAAGIGLGATIKYLRRTTSGAAG